MEAQQLTAPTKNQNKAKNKQQINKSLKKEENYYGIERV